MVDAINAWIDEMNVWLIITIVLSVGLAVSLFVQKIIKDEKKQRRYVSLVYLVMTIIFLAFALIAFLGG